MALVVGNRREISQQTTQILQSSILKSPTLVLTIVHAGPLSPVNGADLYQ